MEGTPAIYLGRIVEKKNFRAFIYGADGQQRLVESWEEFEANMQSGLWFATRENAELSKELGVSDEEVHTMTVDELPDNSHAKPKPKAKPRSKPKPKAKPESVLVEQDADEVLPDDDSVFEVKEGE